MHRHVMARPDLDALHEEYGNWSDVVVDLETRLEDEGADETRAGLLTALAIVVEDQLEDRDRAIELLEQAVDLDIADDLSGERLSALYRAAGEWEALTGLHLDRVEHVSPDDRRALYVETAEVYAAKLGQPEGATLVLQKAILDQPDDPKLLSAAVQVASEHGQQDALAEFLQQQVAEVAESRGESSALPLVVAVGQLQLSLGREDMAGIWFERAMGIDDQHPAVLSALRGIYRADEAWDELADLLARIAGDATDDDAEVEAWRELAAVAADHLGDAERAANALQRALAVSGADAATLDALIALYEQTDDAEKLVETLESLAETTDDAGERAAMLGRVGNLRSTALSDPDGAVRAWQRAFELDPTLDGPWHALLSAWADDVDSRLDLVRQRLEALAPDDSARRLEVYVARARALTEIGDRDEAIASWRSALTIDPAHADGIAALEGLLRDAGRFEDLTTWWRTRATDAEDDDTAVRLLTQAADVYENELDDPTNAAGCLRRVHERRPEDAGVLERLASLYREIGDDESAMGALEQLAGLQGDAERVGSMLEMARMQRDALDPTAVETWRAVLAIAPTNREAIDGLVAWLTERDEWATVLEVLRHDASVERDLARRAAVHARMGLIRLDHRDDPAGARADFETALELDPDCADAATPLADVLLASEEWAPALPLLEMLARHHESDPAETRAVLHYNLAAANEALERTEEAIAHYTRSLEFESDNRDARFALAALLDRAERWDAAADQWKSIVAEYAILLDEDAQLDTYWRAGRAAARAGDTERAKRYLNSALAIDEWHEASLKELAALDGDGGGRRTFEARKRLLELTEDPRERFKLLVELGDLANEGEDAAAAVEAWRAALEIEADSRVVMHKLLDLFTRTEQWKRAAEVLGRLSELETDPERRIKLLFAVAALFRDQLEDFEQATTFFNIVLDADPSRLEAFEAIDHMLAGARLWESLEREYRRMLERLGAGDVTVRMHLFRNLARIYNEKMGRPDDAIAALRGALSIDPENVDVLEAIAAIHPSAGKTDEDLIAQHEAILAVRADRANSWHILFGAHKRRREFDRAWRIAGLLETMNAADPDEKAFYREHRPRTLPMARATLSDADLRLIQHPAMDLLLTRLFATLAVNGRRRFARPASDYGVNPATDLVDLSRHHPITDLVSYALDTVGAPRPDVYVKTGTRGLLHAGMDTASVLLGDDIIGATPNRQLVFRLGRMAFLSRIEVQMGAMYPASDALKTFVYGALGLFTGSIVPQPSEEAVRGVVDELGRLPKADLEALGAVVQGMIQSGSNPDVSSWLRGVEFTANRVGLLLCGDVRRAVEAVRTEPSPIGRADVNDKVRDLLVYSTTNAYETLRAKLRLGIGQQ